VVLYSSYAFTTRTILFESEIVFFFWHHPGLSVPVGKSSNFPIRIFRAHRLILFE